MESSKLLPALIVLAVAVSLVGTTISLSKITGMDVLETKGSVDATITSQTAINLSTNTIDFGTGTVATGCQNCTMSSDGVEETPDCCTGFTIPSTALIIENIGNKNVTLNVSHTEDADSFIGGSNPLYQTNVTENEAGSCNVTSGYGSWGDINEKETVLCQKFYPDKENDEIQAFVKLRIPDNSKTGLLNASFNFTATTLTS